MPAAGGNLPYALSKLSRLVAHFSQRETEQVWLSSVTSIAKPVKLLG
jgi:hypothetical protein